MMRFFRLLVLAAVSFAGTAQNARADFSKLLEPVPGTSFGRPSPSQASQSSQPSAAPQQALPTRETPETPREGAEIGSRGGAQGQPQVAQLIKTKPTQMLTEAELVAAIEKDLPKRYTISGDLRVSLTRPWVPLKLPAQEFFADCVQLPPGGLSSNMPVTVRGVSNGAIVGEWPLQLRVEIFQEVWVAPHRLERGQLLERGTLVPQRIDVLRETTPPISAAQELTGFELAQTVQSGRPVLRRDLVERSLIKKGQLVDALAGDGGLTVRVRAQAMEAGPAGAVIRVRNLDSRKEFLAQVINENQVQVRF